MQDSSFEDAANSAVRLLRAMYEAQQTFVRGRSTPQEIFDELLNILLSITGSEYGFIGKVLQTPDSTPFLKIYSMTNIAWSAETQALYERHKADGMEFRELSSLYGHVLTTHQAYISNTPAADPHKHGTPSGHPALTSFLGIANRSGGYTEEVISFLEPLISTCAVIIEALNEREQREKITEQVRAGERRYQAIADSITEIFFAFDRNLCFTYWNKAAQELTGFTITETFGKHLLDIFPPNNVSLHAKKIFQQVLETLQAQHFVSEYEWNGEHRVFEVSVYPSNDGISVIAQNITERRRAEAEQALLREQIEQQLADLKHNHEELQAHQQFLDAILTTAPATLYIHDLRSDTAHILNVLSTNVGRSKEYLEGHPIWEMVLASFDAESVRAWEERRANLLQDRTNTVFSLQAHYRRPNGKWSWGLDRAVVLTRSADGVPEQVLCASTDITDLKRAEEQIQELNTGLEAQVQQRTEELTLLNREKEELLSIAAHDLKSPLQGISLAAGLAQQYFRQGNMTKVLEILHSIEHASQSAGETLATFLSASAIESGAVRLNITEVSSVLVQDIVAAYQVRAEAKNIHLEYTMPQTPLYFKADRIALREVLENLLSNAVKFSPKGKNIFVRIKSQKEGHLSNTTNEPMTNNYIRIEVQDEGPGISEEDKKRLFGKFVRLTARPTAGEYSTGLGLSIVKKMVEAMNGNVWCESELADDLSTGSTFIVELPVV